MGAVKNWGVFCQWGGAVACVFFITINILVLIDYGEEMDRITCVLRGFSILFALSILMMSVNCLRNWAKDFLSFAWFLSNWGTRGFFLVYLGVVAASSYAIERETQCDRSKLDAHQREAVDDWVDYTRYIAGALLAFFGILYGMLSCCGGGKDEEEDIKQPQWGAAGGQASGNATPAAQAGQNDFAMNNQAATYEMNAAGGQQQGMHAVQMQGGPQNVPQQQGQRTYNYK